MKARSVGPAVFFALLLTALPASASAAPTFARTDYPLPTVSPRMSNIGPQIGDDHPLALVDLNKDGKLDVVIADFGNGHVDVLLNQGAGTFADAPGSPFDACASGMEADRIVGGQLNPQTDQNPDVAVACDFDGGFVRLLGDGTGSLGMPTSFLTGSVQPLSLGHVTGPGSGDYVFGYNSASCFVPVTSFGNNSAVICDGAVPGGYLTPVHFYDDPCFGGDEMLTLDSGTTFMGAALIARPADPPHSCTAPFSSSSRNSDVDSAHFNLSELTTGDVDGDGDPDVLIGDGTATTGNIHVMPWLGASADFDGGIPPAAHPTNFASAGGVLALAVADFDRDGCPDIAGAEVLPSEQDVVALYAGHCNATQFDTAKTFDVAGDQNTFTDYPKFAVGDLNGDNKPDIVTTAGYVGSATVLLNTTGGSSPPPPPPPPVTRTLTVARSGAGNGTVTSAPAGIDCGATCSAGYDDGTNVTLTAAAAAGSKFDGWSGDCSGTGACSVAMSADRSLTASFSKLVRAARDRPARLKRTTYKITRAGTVTLLIENPNVVKATGNVRLTTKSLTPKIAAAATTRRRKAVTIGRASFSAPAKAVVRVKVRLIKKVRAWLKTHRELPANALIVLKPHGKSLSVTIPITIKRRS